MRLRCGGYVNSWGFGIYRASHDDYQDSILLNGAFAGTAEVDCDCRLYLIDPTAWQPPNTDELMSRTTSTG